MKIQNSRHVLFLVGMHRSGTSALSAALHACGATFGSGLLEPMEGVNERGFWESADVVALNERLLALVGATWYSVSSAHLHIDWMNPKFGAERREAEDVFRRGFGSGPLEVVKDPRFCITLPFWLALCRNLNVRTSVCVMARAPVEVCHSLKNRDDFPIGYSIRLVRTYLRGIAASVPPDTLHATYDRLLGDPVNLLRELGASLPIIIDEEKLAAAVLVEMKHQYKNRNESSLELRDYKDIDFEALDTQIEELYPIEETLTELVNIMVRRGKELTRIGESHSRALQTLRDRDADIKQLTDELIHARSVIATRDAEKSSLHQQLQQLGSLHTQALSTVNERDRQLENFDRRLQDIGELHSQALAVIEERDEQQKDFNQRLAEIGSLHTKALRVIEDKDWKISELDRLSSEMRVKLEKNDAQLQRIFQKPGVGLLFRAMWKYETC